MRNLRNIIIVTVIAIIVLLVSGTIISLEWRSSWNVMLGSLILNIIASLFGISAGILTAILIVDKYLDNQRKEKKKKQELEESLYKERWQAYIHGGVSVLSAIITHLSLFVSYGKDAYLQILSASGDTSHVPSKVSDYIPWLIYNLQFSHRAKKELGDIESAKRSGMGEQEALRITNELRDRNSLSITCAKNDLTTLSFYLRKFSAHMRDQIILFQPFLPKRMEFGIVLIHLAHSLDDEAEFVEQLLENAKKEGSGVTLFNLGTDFTSRYRSLGQDAIRAVKLIWAYADTLEKVSN